MHRLAPDNEDTYATKVVKGKGAHKTDDSTGDDLNSVPKGYVVLRRSRSAKENDVDCHDGHEHHPNQYHPSNALDRCVARLDAIVRRADLFLLSVETTEEKTEGNDGFAIWERNMLRAVST